MASSSQHHPLLTIVAGEASGDTHGAALMEALLKHDPSLIFNGYGGPKMAAVAENVKLRMLQNDLGWGSGCQYDWPGGHRIDCRQATLKGRTEQERVSPIPNFLSENYEITKPEPTSNIENWIAEAGVLGLWDVLKKYGYFRKKFSALLKQLSKNPPEAIILVDYPGFNLRLAKAIRRRKLPIKIFYYISPQVWAWNRRRIPEMARNLDLMICIFPFEKELYEASGLPTKFAGHPLVEKLTAERKENTSTEREELLLGLFPGSREREVRKIFPVMLEAARRVLCTRPEIQCEVAAATKLHAATMENMIKEAQLPITISVAQAHQLMQRATFSLVCSGTATLEAACFGLPYALVYKVAWLTYIVGRQLIRVPYLGIINILANRPIVHEFIQNEATAEALAKEALHFLNNKESRQQLTENLENVVSTLQGEGAYDQAAKHIIDANKKKFTEIEAMKGIRKNLSIKRDNKY